MKHILFLATALTVTGVSGCKKTLSREKALESDDWFRDGVDRFYFATVSTATLQEGTTVGARVGQNMLVGIGCYGEPKDPATLVDVPKDACGQGESRMPLNARTMWHQFPIADDASKPPQKGQCVQLLGDFDLVKHTRLYSEDFATGIGQQAWNKFMGSAGFCALSLAFMSKPGQAAMDVAWKKTKTGASWVAKGTASNAKAVASKFQFGRWFAGPIPAAPISEAARTKFAFEMASRGLTGPQVFAKALPVGAMDDLLVAQTAMVGTTTSFIGRMANSTIGKTAGTVLDLLPCASTGFSMASLIRDKRDEKNIKALFGGIQRAEELAKADLARGKHASKFAEFEKNKNYVEYQNLLIPAFVQNFNKNVNDKFEQGWALPGSRPEEFFDMVRGVQGEIDKMANEVVQKQAP
jgi:hypothetical protein